MFDLFVQISFFFGLTELYHTQIYQNNLPLHPQFLSKKVPPSPFCTWRWTYSALWYFYFSPGTPWNTSGAILEQFWSHCCRILLWTLIQNKPLHVESLLLCFLLFMPLSFTLLTLYHLPIIQFYSRSWHSLHVCFVPSTICWKYWQSY